MSRETTQLAAEPYGAWLYWLGAAAAALSAGLIPVQVVVFIVAPPPPADSPIEWFTLLRDNKFAGLVDLDLLLVADNLLLILVLVAIYAALRRTDPSTMVLAVALGLSGAVMYIASNPAVQLASLGDQYTVATTDAQRAAVGAAGLAVLSSWQGTAFYSSYLIGSVAGILIGVVMLRSAVFSRRVGWLAVLANVMALGLYLPRVGVFVSVGSVLLLEVWYLLTALGLYRHGRRVHATWAD